MAGCKVHGGYDQSALISLIGQVSRVRVLNDGPFRRAKWVGERLAGAFIQISRPLGHDKGPHPSTACSAAS
jgi:hypothetical protein